MPPLYLCVLFLQTPSLDVIGQETANFKQETTWDKQLGIAVLVQSHVEYLKETVTMMMSVLAICYVDKTTASLQLTLWMTAAMTPIQVSKDFTVTAQIAFVDSL